jgi:anti-anti-sigma regulatory factor
VTVVISGELDLLSTPSLAEHLDQILASSPRHLVFDLSRSVSSIAPRRA